MKLVPMILFAFLCCSCAGRRYYAPIDAGTDSKGNPKGERMALIASINEDYEGEEEIQIPTKYGNIIHKRTTPAGYAGMFEEISVIDPKTGAQTGVTRRAIMPRTSVSSVWRAQGDFLEKGGIAVGKGATPFVTVAAIPPVAGALGAIPGAFGH